MKSNNRNMDTQPFRPQFQRREQATPAHLPLRERPTQRWTQPPSAPEPINPPRQDHRLYRLLITAVILAFLVVSVALATVGGLLLYQADWLAPGVSVTSLDLSGQTQAQAASTLAAAWQNEAVLIEAGEIDLAANPADLGLTLDATATAVLAHQQGRTPASWRNFVQHNGRFVVSPVWTFAAGRAETGLQALAAQAAVAPVEAQLVWQNGRFTALPGQPGQELDVAASLDRLTQQAGMVLANGRFEPVIRAIPPTVTDLSALAAQANALATAPLTIQAYDPVTDETFSHVVPPETWGTWLRINETAATLAWQIDETAVTAFGQALAAEWGNGRYVQADELKTAVTEAIANRDLNMALRVYHQAQPHVVQAGETLASIGRRYGLPYPWIQQANPGLEALSVGQPIIIPSPDEMIPLPVVAHKRIIVSIAQQRTWVYENGALKWEWPVSTGIASSPTAPGVFQIQSHEPNAYAGNWDLWMPSFMGIYRPLPSSDFMNGFHGFPTRSGATLLWTSDLGHPVTYGCILLSSENAQLLYNWAEDGVIVEIQS